MEKNKTKNKREKSVFDKFTNQYSLPKTLRFELRPFGNTEQMLIDSGVRELDKQRKQAYEKTKPFFDRLHQEFINESLSNVQLESLDGYLKLYTNWRKTIDKKEKTKPFEKLKEKEKTIREEIVKLFDKKSADWIALLPQELKPKKINHDFLFERGIFAIAREKYKDDPEAFVEGKSIFDNWDKWTAYFGKFFATRENFYKSKDTATAVATRIVNDNLRRFCENIDLFQKLKKAKVDLFKLEEKFGVNLDEVFTLDYYENCLNQTGIDNFNALIGGPKGQESEGVNQYINKYRQATGKKLSRLKKLDKQIGSDKENFIDLIETDEQLHLQLVEFVQTAKEKVGLFDESVTYLLQEDGNLAGIYFRKEALNTITRRWFDSYEKIAEALVLAANDKNVKYNKTKEEYKFPDFISWQVIKDAVEELASNTEEVVWKAYFIEDEEDKEKISVSREHWLQFLLKNNLNITKFKNNLSVWQQFLTIFQFEYDNLKAKGHEKDGKDFDVLLKEIELMLEQNKKVTETIKAFSDRVLNIYRFAKYFSLEKSQQWNPDGLEVDDFYTKYEEFHTDSFEKIVKVYDKVRNYVTKKPFNQDKWKLNFENPTLADGWDKNKESDNTAVILRKDSRYYLAVMDKPDNNLFKKITSSTSGYEKMTYKLFPDPAKMMPKVCFAKNNQALFHPSDEIIRIYQNSEFKKSDTFSVRSMQTLIDFYKTALNTYEGWSMYNFSHVKKTKEYTENIGQFYRDVAEDGYQISFDYVSEEYIEKANQDGKLYLFEIHNKDWNLKDGAKKTGTKNTHTLYFEQVFSDENNRNNFVIKLNGKAELFFRPKTKEEKLTYKKWDSDQEKWTKASKGDYGAVVDGRRYSKDKMFFHVPLTLNRTAPDAHKFNQSINEFLANNPDINIIGIDRGEKHLAYLSVINQKGEILEIKSLNKIDIKDEKGMVTKVVDYAQLLEDRAKNREQARRDWQNVEQIKDLKKGYIAHVVREIADLIIKYNAIVVFEDLNMRFKQVRGGIEKSVYQQLEKALIEKLNFLIDKKEIDPNKAGHILKAYQLTGQFESFKKMGKQTGVLFYTQAEYTSQTDPVTGFRKNIYISNSATVGKMRDFVEKFDAIGWDDELQSYYFTYNPINFVTDSKFKDSTLTKEWTVYAKIPRIKREKKSGYWETVPLNPNDEFLKLFELWSFDNLHAEDIKDQILQMLEEERLNGAKEFDGRNRNFWQSFVYLFNLVMQVRNSTATQFKKDDKGNVDVVEGVDFIASPVEPFFCTEAGKYTKGYVNMAGMEEKVVGDDALKQRFVKEFNGDANGAYNIARKGKIILDKISGFKNQSKDQKKNIDLFITKKDWDKFTQNNKK